MKLTNNRPLLQRRNSLINTFQAMVDASIIMITLVVFVIYKFGFFSYSYLAFAIFLLAVTAFTYDVNGVYRRHSSSTQKAISLGRAWAVSFGVIISLMYLLRVSELLSREVLVQVFVTGYFAQLVSHIGFRRFQRKVAVNNASNCLILGTGQLAEYVYSRINSNPWLTEAAVGMVSLAPDSSEREDPNVIGTIDELDELIEKNDIRSVYIAVPLESSPVIEKVYFDLLDCNVDIHWAPNIFALPLINHSVKEFSGIPILTLSETPLIGTHTLLKAIEDKFLASVVLILSSPILLVAAIAVKVTSKGPVLFRQPRTGWDGKEFLIYKFRSMYVHAVDAELKQASKHDPRITRVGRFIRKTSIDELPQLFNVLLGDMSMVGPRPHAVEHNIEYSSKITAYLGRHRIKPGITGLAQVRGYRGETKEIELMNQRVKHDLEYINNWSISLDISILLMTAVALFRDEAH